LKKYQFRLESYLKIKEFEEKNSWSEVLAQEARVASIQSQMDQLEFQRGQIRFKLSLIGQQRGPGLYEIDLGEESLNATKKRLENLAIDLEKEKKLLERLKIKHAEAKKELKTIEKLKEREKIEYKSLKEKMDSKNITEIAGQMYLRRKAQNE
jgi:flagellar export protein FliJ